MPIIINGIIGPTFLLIELLIAGCFSCFVIISDAHKINLFLIKSNNLNLISTFTIAYTYQEHLFPMNTTLLILAAGMGSRYGGMKQVDPFGPSGETITDYSIYDAIQAGFDRFVFVISPGMEEDFRTNYVKKFPSHLKVDYVIQSIDNIPEGFTLPDDRIKPWGTAHAVLMAKDAINEPFAVINADDFYGKESYAIMHDFLVSMSILLLLPWFRNTMPEGLESSYQAMYLNFVGLGLRIRST